MSMHLYFESMQLQHPNFRLSKDAPLLEPLFEVVVGSDVSLVDDAAESLTARGTHVGLRREDDPSNQSVGSALHQYSHNGCGLGVGKCQITIAIMLEPVIAMCTMAAVY